MSFLLFIHHYTSSLKYFPLPHLERFYINHFLSPILRGSENYCTFYNSKIKLQGIEQSHHISAIMGPKINGNSIAELVSNAVERQMEKKFDDYNNLLTDALSRIASLEEELAQSRQNSNPLLPISKSSSKSDICRHWLKNQCTWKQRCRFSHGGGATSTPSLSDTNAKDLEEVAPDAKEKVDKSVQVEFLLDCTSSPASTCEIPMESSVC